MDEVYPGTQRRTQKYPWAMKMFGLKYAGFSTENHELHRIRRGAVSHYFSKASIMKLEPGIQKVIGQMLTRLRDLRGSGKVLNMVDVYASLTGDIIGQYAYGKTFDFLADDSFSPWWHHMIMDVSENGHFMKQFSWLMPIFMGMPAQMVKMMNPLMFSLMNFRDVSCMFKYWVLMHLVKREMTIFHIIKLLIFTDKSLLLDALSWGIFQC